MNKPTFSVIIPAYNAAKTLRSTVASVFAQSDQCFEIIIVDDGSTDDTLQVMLQIAAMDWRVRIISQPNSGVSATRNFGAKLAKGDYLAFLDADDQWTADKLARHRSLHEMDPLLEASFARVAFCPEQRGELGSDRTVSSVPLGSLEMEHVIAENAICTTSNLVIDSAVFAELGGFNEALRYAEDQELMARLIEYGSLVSGIQERLVRYRMSEDGLSCDFEAMLEAWRSFAAQWIDAKQLATAEALYCRYLARRALRAGVEVEVARSFARRGLAADRSAFVGTGGRGILTIGGVIAASAMPASMRRAVFA